MPLDPAAIRRRWAAPPWTNGRSPELAADIAAMLSEVARLRSELAAAQAATVDKAASACAAQLRAAGWTPSHARLEWRSNGWQHHLHLCIDHLCPELLFAAQLQSGTWNVFDRINDTAPCILRRGTTETAAATVAEWCAATLPSLHLPPFPGVSDAS